MMQFATPIEKQEFFMTVEKVEAVAGNLAAWSQSSQKNTPPKQHSHSVS